MAKEMLINVSAGEECRIALLDEGRLEELYMERTSATSHVGNIYKGKVTNVEPSIQAAFIDFGIGRNGFLHISDLMPSYFGKKGDGYTEPVGRKLSRRDRPPIQQCLRKGDEIIVQIIKEGIGTKGPTLSTYLSIPGRVLVMMPGMAKMGISKKIEDEVERARLRKILDGLKPPKDCGFIIRTAGIGKSKLEIERDLKYLARLWEQLKKKIDKDKPPVELYTEGDLVTRTVRDVFTADIDAIIIDDEETAKKVKDFIKLAMPRTKNKVQSYEETLPLFHKYDIEGEIEKIYSRRVPLPSGGSLIIDQTEAVVAIDVNSGKFRDHSDAETTAFKTDMEAADEIPRQLKLRDMGGVIICDFIDLRFERHRREVEERLHNNLKNDRAKTRMLRMSQFGIIEMTRQRMRPSLKRSIYQECASCNAHGMVKTPESMSLDVMRKLRIAMADTAVVRVQLTVHPEVATYLQNRKRAELARLEDANEKRVVIASDPSVPTDQMKFELFDSRDGFIFIAELGMSLPAVNHQRPHAGGRGRDHRNDRDRNDRQHKPKHDRREEESEAIDADDLFSEEAEEPKPKKVAKSAEQAPDDEGSVVEIDEGGTELPGSAPGVFFEPGEGGHREGGGHRDGGNRDRNDRGRRRRRRGRRGRGGQQGGDDRNYQDSDQPRPSEDGDRDVDVDDVENETEIEDGASIDEPRADAPRPHRSENQIRDPNRDQNQNRDRDQNRGGGHQNRRDNNRGGYDNRDNRRGGGQQEPRRDQRDNRPNQQNRPPQNAVKPLPVPHADDADVEVPPVSNKSSIDYSKDERNEEGAGGRRRRRRGGRGRRRGGGGGGGGSGGGGNTKQSFDRTGLPDDEELDREAAALEAKLQDSGSKPEDKSDQGNAVPDAPRPRRSSAPKRVPPSIPVVKTGSTDKHLADDIPVDHDPVSRPRSRRDLDELPDFDD